ncbi:hypothetical protein KW807_01410 [Candidatus Parcubacteria bacterium]|nr:hypothetical protein [Candidatus Parcubacteria bacterium]
MPQNKPEEKTGTVVESLPNIMFRVQPDEGGEEIEPYGGKARIIKRL